MSYTLGEAARATGKSKPTIARAIKTGKLSADRGDDGAYSIDPAELNRIYPLAGNGAGTMKQSVTGDVPGHGSEHRDRLVLEQAETIRDLRARLDASEGERRTLQGQLTALLTDQRPNGAAPPDPTRSRWRRLLRALGHIR